MNRTAKIGFNAKTLVPIFIAVIFVSSIFVVFERGGSASDQARLVVDFGQPGLSFDRTVGVGNDTTALRMLSANANDVKLENGKIKCITDYCNTEKGIWKFYKVVPNPLGYDTATPEQTAESYIVQKGDIIMFRYEFSLETQNQTNTTSNSVTFDNSGKDVTVNGIDVPLNEEDACKVYSAAGFGECGKYTNITEKENGTFVIAGLCQTNWSWCKKGMPISWATINSTSLKIEAIAIT